MFRKKLGNVYGEGKNPKYTPAKISCGGELMLNWEILKVRVKN
jgi:hypothetical protein